MSDDLQYFIDQLRILVYTLVDGSRVMGEEREYDYTNGIVQVYGVVEFNQYHGNVTLSPYVPEAIDSVFVFTDRNIIGRCNATFELKTLYYNSLLKFRLKQVLSEEEYDKYLNIQKKPIGPLDSYKDIFGNDLPPHSRN